jgi:outer membrane protein
MNRLIVGVSALLVMLVALAAGASSAEAQTVRLGYINSQRIMAEAPGTTEAQQAFEQDMERYRLELERLEADLETLQDNFERQQGTLSASVRQERQQEITQRFMSYQARRAELEESAQVRQEELVGPIMRRISEVIDVIRAEGNWAMIFDVAGGPVIVAADPALDLTNQVIQRLRTNP